MNHGFRVGEFATINPRDRRGRGDLAGDDRPPKTLGQRRLRIVVDQQNLPAQLSEGAGEVVRAARLADPSFLIQHRQNGHGRSLGGSDANGFVSSRESITNSRRGSHLYYRPAIGSPFMQSVRGVIHGVSAEARKFESTATESRSTRCVAPIFTVTFQISRLVIRRTLVIRLFGQSSGG